jgi:transposase
MLLARNDEGGDGATAVSARLLQVHLWDGPLLSTFLKKQPGVTLKERECQHIFRQEGFGLRKPRLEFAQAYPSLQAVKKTPATRRRP